MKKRYIELIKRMVIDYGFVPKNKFSGKCKYPELPIKDYNLLTNKHLEVFEGIGNEEGFVSIIYIDDKYNERFTVAYQHATDIMKENNFINCLSLYISDYGDQINENIIREVIELDEVDYSWIYNVYGTGQLFWKNVLEGLGKNDTKKITEISDIILKNCY